MKDFIAGVIALLVVVFAFVACVSAHVAIGACIVLFFDWLMGCSLFSPASVGIVALCSWVGARLAYRG